MASPELRVADCSLEAGTYRPTSLARLAPRQLVCLQGFPWVESYKVSARLVQRGFQNGVRQEATPAALGVARLWPLPGSSCAVLAPLHTSHPLLPIFTTRTLPPGRPPGFLPPLASHCWLLATPQLPFRGVEINVHLPLLPSFPCFPDSMEPAVHGQVVLSPPAEG